MVLEHKVQESWLVGVEGKIKERGVKIPYAAMDLSRGQGELRARRKRRPRPESVGEGANRRPWMPVDEV